MPIPSRLLICITLSLGTVSSASAQTSARDEDAFIEFFEKKIRPLLVENCYNCHSANTNSRGGLRVDDLRGLTIGGGRGPAVVPGHPEKSLLIEAVRKTHAEVKMPPKGELTPAQVADMAKWIKDGAAWPKARVPAAIGRPNPEYEKHRKEHWAFQPVNDDAWRAELRKQPVDDAWPRDDIDRLLLVSMRAKGIKPGADADPVTLIRRLTFDLTGLPPTVEEMNAFVSSWDAPSAKRQAAYEAVVDRLLASPAYGERWGRHWLDIARYGESTGSARNLPYPHAWRYRDYVIDAFNKDTPFDQFIRQQIAGDLLPLPSPSGRGTGGEGERQKLRDEYLTATGFLAMGVRDVNQRFKIRFVMDNIDEQIDAVTRSFLALTVSCARCHDHKFDPIPTTDYYALAGIFQSSDVCAGLRNKMGGGGLDYYDTNLLLTLGGRSGPDDKTLARIDDAKARLVKARADLLDLSENPDKIPAGPEREKKMTAARAQITKVQNELITLADPAAHGPVAMGARDAKLIGDCEVRVRGEAEKIGPLVPRGFLTTFDVPGAAKIDPKHSGRLELANWIASDKNPLTARVIVNRVWHHLFGQGIVGSVDNFGVTGDKPSHPELLDHLAHRFSSPLPSGGEGPGVRGMAWSIKRLIRTIVLTRAYQLGSAPPSPSGRGAGGEGDPLKVDPANRLVWRHNPRRLSAEEIRDAMLAASGNLDRTRIKGSPAMDLKVTELSNTSALAKQLEESANTSVRRSVYLPLVRLITPKSLEVFDFAEQGLVVGSRDTTTVATQALYLLNDQFVRQQAQSLAARVLALKGANDDSRIALAYRLALSRPATAKEIERAIRYITDYENAVSESPGTAVPGPREGSRVAAWSSFCQALLASAEFRYIR